MADDFNPMAVNGKPAAKTAKSKKTKTTVVSESGNSLIGKEILEFCDRLDRLDEEGKEIRELKTQVGHEIKARGLNPKMINRLRKLREDGGASWREGEMEFDSYLAAAGMQSCFDFEGVGHDDLD
ncbi:GapR family DNA-binding domain-containing protein [Martelella sp. HB161492]|uniref:GapR family DNA-binding domain-containing protein n=1 Tax=Martelella sp. HB161492 TaxID=2720726 RepID=UPI0015911D0F|nr:GapR family DNA-binding domain-containing protein [Martelella sp. HB161492]